MGSMKARFHPEMFKSAVIGLIGRAPDEINMPSSRALGEVHHFTMIYQPKDQSVQSAREMRRHIPFIREWLDHFDIRFSKSRVEWATHAWRGGGDHCLNIEVEFE